MGFWGSGLYANDLTCDVRDAYKELIQNQQNSLAAYQTVIEEFKECFGTDEEPLFWFALADTQWKLGRLMPEVREKALALTQADGGLSQWIEDGKNGDGWRRTLAKLETRLNSPQPKEKMLKRIVTNPWNIGDVYAYRFLSEQSKDSRLYGKYIVIQKIADELWEGGKTYSRIQIYKKVFLQLPNLESIADAEILPIDYPDSSAPFEYDQRHLDMNAVMIVLGVRDYPQKCLTYLGNQNDSRKMPRYYKATCISIQSLLRN